jgi:hypothetical protein
MRDAYDVAKRYERLRRVRMSADRDHTADPEQPLEGGFAEGQADKTDPDEARLGRFSKGQEELGEVEDPEKHHKGRFSEGQEELGEEDPEKHIQGRYGYGEGGGEDAE